MLQFLPQLVRRGYATPYHFALSRDLPSASRVDIHQAYVNVAQRLQRSAADDWSTIRDKLLVAQVNSADMPVAAPEGTPISRNALSGLHDRLRVLLF